MIDRLDRLIDDVTGLNSKLILLIGPPQCGKTKLLVQLSERRRTPVLTVGSLVGRSTLAVPAHRRHLHAAGVLIEVADRFAPQGLLLLDNIEVLFDRTLQLDPLDLLKRQAHARRVVAVWPGEQRGTRLTYAAVGHPEHQDYGANGLVLFSV